MKKVVEKVIEKVDESIILIRDAMHEDAIPAWRGEAIIDSLLDARHAATANDLTGSVPA